ncbi:MAG: helicase-related protein, partial [Planctomycetia bacterium]|nr:helicase-related protein [Planctomycetia bacterium]
NQNRRYRERIARHLIQRKRGDILHFLKEKTEFPTSESKEQSYRLSPEYRQLFDRAMDYAHELVYDRQGQTRHRRVRWWSALALLRALGSSPAAAAATLSNRSRTLDAKTNEEVDEIGMKLVCDPDATDSADATDLVLGSDLTINEEEETAEVKLSRKDRNLLREMAGQAESLRGEKDLKLLTLVEDLKRMILKDGFHPIIFCRFIQTAEYLGEELRKRFPKVEIAVVTGLLPPEERVARIEAMATSPSRILVCTDCLSEGINLQSWFDSVIHYDMSWNPTRHEQREGRVNRFGQQKMKLRMITYYCTDNQIDGLILNVLLRKHRRIRDSLGISVPVPCDTQKVVEAILADVLDRRYQRSATTPMLPGMEAFLRAEATAKLTELDELWKSSGENEKRRRTVFAQESLVKNVDEIEREMDAVREAIGSTTDLRQFVTDILTRSQATVRSVSAERPVYEVDISRASAILKDYCGTLLNPGMRSVTEKTKKTGKRKRSETASEGSDTKFRISFAFPPQSDEIYVSRTHPLVETLSDYVLNTALDAETIQENSSDGAEAIASRCGVIRTSAVRKRTTLLLLRLRFHLISYPRGVEHRTLASQACLLGFRGSPVHAEWITDESELRELLDHAVSTANPDPAMARDRITEVLSHLEELRPKMEEAAKVRSGVLRDSHLRVRQITTTAEAVGKRVEVVPERPDLLGIYVYLPDLM